jgi:hypothetical protein
MDDGIFKKIKITQRSKKGLLFYEKSTVLFSKTLTHLLLIFRTAHAIS